MSAEHPARALEELLLERGAYRTTGVQLGRYTLGPRIHQGATSVIVEADEADGARPVALQLLRHLGEDPQARAARIRGGVARVSHPNLAPIVDVGVVEGYVYVAMERLTGATLAALLKKRTAGDWRATLRTLAAAALGLFALHRRGFVHVHFTLGSVLVGRDGEVRVLDLAHVRTAGEADVPLGAPAYTAPELLRGALIDARVDQFSLCVALFEGLYGAPPFTGETALEVWTAMAEGQIAGPPAQDGPLRALHAVLRRGLQARPGERWRDLMQLLQEIDEVAPGEGVPGEREGVVPAGFGLLLIPLLAQLCR